jgi:TPR repeat protein
MDQLDRLKLPLVPAGAVAELALLMSKPKVSRTVVSVLMYVTVVAFPLAAQEAKPDPKNFEKTKAQAEAGDAIAQRELGRHYFHGAGVAQDDFEAAKWYRKAAEQNDAKAEVYLGDLYYHGRQVPKDGAEAAKWYRRAAEQNDAAGQFNLGACYSEGSGVPEDDVQAYKWLALAVAQGHREARGLLQVLENVLTPVQKAEGQKLVREFKPKAPSARPESSATTTPTASPP